MNRFLCISTFLILLSFSIKAQEFLPFASSNYAGVTGLHLQPASAVDSRYKFDMAVSATSFGFANTFYGIDPYVIWHPESFDSKDFWKTNLTRNINGDPKSLLISMKQDFLSFMFQISDKEAIAFTPSVRTIINFDNISEDLARLADSGLVYHELWNVPLENANFSLQMNSWLEYGFTYARVIADKEKHFLKAGVTMKIVQGLGAAYMFVKDLNYEFTNNDTLSLYNSYASYGASGNFGTDIKYHFDANPSLCFDLGAVYEYRPAWMHYKYDLDGQTNIWQKDEDKYLFRLGVTISDLGSVRYKRNELSRDFVANVHNMYIGDMGAESVADIDTIIQENFNLETVPSKYNMNLPTAISFQADVRIAKGLYLNFTPFLALKQGTHDENKVHYLSSFNLIPRYDLKWFGISFPVQYNSYKQLNIGLGVRLGPLWLGSNDLFSTLSTGKVRYGSAFSAVLKVPVLYKRYRDKDNDKVSDKKDLCPDVPGIFDMQGCPDSDWDGITDNADKCPNVAGLKELDGCPDTDGDGIIDENDRCPDVKGLAQFAGCPDSDGDSIIDQDDACPNNAGLVSLAGCPDQDGDGIPDKDDNCPTVAGNRENRGCPYIDSDNDGLIDEEDFCPSVFGPSENHGCPYLDTDHDNVPDKDDDCPNIFGDVLYRGCPDTDRDSVPDKYDLCPTIRGVQENNGCPEIRKEDQEKVKMAFENLEFEPNKAIIKSKSFVSLNALSDMMIEQTEYKLSLSGHTDNSGNEETNSTLSEKRTMAVKNYLVNKGVDPQRIKTEWFGQTMPIAPNDTSEGRKKNNRVEILIYFE